MKTKFFKSLLAIACLLSSTNVSAQKDFFMVDSIYYMPNSESSCTIFGHDPKHPDREDRKKYKGDLHIPDTVVYKNKKYAVTVIGLQAFQHTNFTSVTIPNTITEIGEYSFNGCKSLTNVVIPNSVTTIKEHAFTDCTSLTNITIPNSVTEIGWMAFLGCTSLTNVVIPNSVTVIESYAFQDCIGLTNMTIPNSVEKIGDDVFRNCSGLTNVTIGKSVEKIGMSPFKNCTALSTLYLLNPTPPMLDYDLGNNLSENLTIFVPQSALAAYKQDLRWKNFQNLQGFDPK